MTDRWKGGRKDENVTASAAIIGKRSRGWVGNHRQKGFASVVVSVAEGLGVLTRLDVVFSPMDRKRNSRMVVWCMVVTVHVRSYEPGPTASCRAKVNADAARERPVPLSTRRRNPQRLQFHRPILEADTSSKRAARAGGISSGCSVVRTSWKKNI